jgi:hypothetical protein
MADLNKTRSRLKIAIGVLLALDVAAGAALLTTWAGREDLRHAQMRQLWLDLKARQSAPWRGLDKKIPVAQKQIESFYRDRLPAGYSEISNTLYRIASQSGVQVSSDKYKQEDSEIQDLPRIEVDADVSGDYLALMRFINSVERSKVFFIVDALDLGGEQGGGVRLHIKFETYLRTA